MLYVLMIVVFVIAAIPVIVSATISSNDMTWVPGRGYVLHSELDDFDENRR